MSCVLRQCAYVCLHRSELSGSDFVSFWDLTKQTRKTISVSVRIVAVCRTSSTPNHPLGDLGCWERREQLPERRKRNKVFGICVTSEYKIYSIPQGTPTQLPTPADESPNIPSVYRHLSHAKNQKKPQKREKLSIFPETGCLRFALQHFLRPRSVLKSQQTRKKSYPRF